MDDSTGNDNHDADFIVAEKESNQALSTLLIGDGGGAGDSEAREVGFEVYDSGKMLL